MPKIDEQIAVVARKIEQNRNRLKDLRGRVTKQNRKDDARRKLLYGAAYLAALPSLSTDAQKRSLERIEACITRPKDREFLGLRPLETGEPEASGTEAEEAPEADPSAESAEDGEQDEKDQA